MFQEDESWLNRLEIFIIFQKLNVESFIFVRLFNCIAFEISNQILLR